jgi:hypothetical protein
VDPVSTKLDAEKRLALQEEKQALEAKLLDVYVPLCLNFFRAQCNSVLYRPKMKARLAELRKLAEERYR